MAARRPDNSMHARDDDAPVIPRRRVQAAADMDITPMIDITFLLLIFFIVSSTMQNQTAVELPKARHGAGVSHRTAVVVTLAERETPGDALVYLADGCVGNPLPDDPDIQRQKIVEAVQRGVHSNKKAVLIKAAKGVKHREVSRVSAAASEVEGISGLHLGVFEVD